MARSKKTPPAKPTKDDVIRMRVTAEQKAAITAAAERDGLEVSAWLRQLALRAAGALPKQEPRRRA
jgi:uncharacterized protein (DUF1778 family)